MTADIGDDDRFRELSKIIEDLFKGFGASHHQFPIGSSSPEEMAWRAAVEAWFFQEILTFRRDLEHLLTTLPEVLGNDPTKVLDLSGRAHIEANLDGRKYMIIIEPLEDDTLLPMDFEEIYGDDWNPEEDNRMVFSPHFLEEWE